jgi:hypothetical protein
MEKYQLGDIIEIEHEDIPGVKIGIMIKVYDPPRKSMRGEFFIGQARVCPWATDPGVHLDFSIRDVQIVGRIK